MNLYNAIGISQHSNLEKILARFEVMLKYYEKDLKKTNLKLNEIENDEKLEYVKKYIETEKIKKRINENDKIYSELLNGLELIKNPKMKKEYDQFIKINPNASVKDFMNKDQIEKEKIEVQKNNEVKKYKLDNEKLNRIYNYNVPNYLEFNPNQSEKYNKNSVKSVKYNSLLKKEEHSFLFADEKITINLVGRLEYKTIFGLQDLGFYKYKIKKTVLDGKMNLPKEYEVFSQINIKTMTENVEYKNYVSKVLLSNLNIEMAQKYNGDYVGEVIVSQQNTFSIIHQQERLCAAIENKLTYF